MAETKDQLQQLWADSVNDIMKAAETADQDPARPEYHFHAISQWMDDPNGIIYHKGYYHMMYSWNPNTSRHRAGMVYKTAHRVWDPHHEDWTGGITVWGHARSKDMVHWEHLPIALYPVIDKGEHFIWFGTAALNGNGIPVAVYTSVGPDKRPEDTADQWLWFGDDELLSWTPAKENPILSYDLHGGENLAEWRDPFIIRHGGRGYLILGAKRIGEEKTDAVIALYEAVNREYTEWKYRGVIFSLDDETVPSCECPNLVKIQDRWVILVSPHGPVEYYVGDMNFEEAKFTVESRGIVDFSTNFYATNVLGDDKGRRIMWGALEGFCDTKGWNGCVSLPRQLMLSTDGRLLQQPVEELKILRKECNEFTGTVKQGERKRLFELESGTAELKLKLKTDGTVKIVIPSDAKAEIIIGNGVVTAGGKSAVYESAGETELTIYLDKTIIEIFLGNGACLTSVLQKPFTSGTVQIISESGDSQVIAVAYNLNCTGLFSNDRFC